jgi:hypothetical protein
MGVSHINYWQHNNNSAAPPMQASPYLELGQQQRQQLMDGHVAA